jgi:methylenetetrahydrofolate dehydrogenase (NADP+)/methenyltetrahydrofolate cyclohydrolase
MSENSEKKSAILIDGKKLSEEIIGNLKIKIADMENKPGLAVILVGDDPASKLYITNKKKACQKAGITFHEYRCGGDFYPNITEKEIIDMIEFLNKDQEIDGIIVQLPIPKKFNTDKIIKSIAVKKDVDGFHPARQDALKENIIITSPLIRAVRLALKATNQLLKQKQAVIVSKNPIFSTPLKDALEQDGLKVSTIKPEDNYGEKTRQADILIVIVGKKNTIKKSMVKPGAIVIDIGTNLISDQEWIGDVDAKANEVAGWITPVPGGIGPLTVAMLLENTYDASMKNKKQ